MFDEEEFQHRTKDAIGSMRERLDDIEAANDAGDYRKVAQLWLRIRLASGFLENGAKIAARNKAVEN